MKMNKIFLMILALALITVSCKKNEDEVTAPDPKVAIKAKWAKGVESKVYTFGTDKVIFGDNGLPIDAGSTYKIIDALESKDDDIDAAVLIENTVLRVSTYEAYVLSGADVYKSKNAIAKADFKVENLDLTADFDKATATIEIKAFDNTAVTGNWLFTTGTYISGEVVVGGAPTKKTFGYVKVSTAGKIIVGIGTGDAEYIFDGDDGTLADAAKAEVKRQAEAASFPAITFSGYYLDGSKKMYVINDKVYELEFTAADPATIKVTSDDIASTLSGETFTENK